MYTVFNDIRRYFAVFSALFLTLITTKVRGHDSCSPEEMMKCSKPLSVLTDSGLTYVNNKADLDRLCPDWLSSIHCIHRYSRHCMHQNQSRHFKKLFRGTEKVVHELCKNGTYQTEFLKHASCMSKAEPASRLCFKKYTKKMHEIQSSTPVQEQPEPDLVMFQKRKREAADEGIKSVCCAFQEYVECSTHIMARVCGEEVEDFSRRFLKNMSSTMIDMHCVNYGPRECGLISAAPNLKSVASLAAILSLVTLLLR